MGKKILYIVLGALVVFGLLFLAYTWFFSGTPSNKGNDGLGSAGDVTGLPSAGGTNTNGQTNIGSSNPNGTAGSGSDTNGTISLNPDGSSGSNGSSGSGNVNGNSDSSGVNGGIAGGLGGLDASSSVFTNVDGVSWLGTPFNPADINSLQGGAGGSAPTISSTAAASGGGTSLIGVLAATAVAGALTCAIQAGYITLQTTQATGVATAITATAGAIAAAPADIAAGLVDPPLPGTSPGVQPNVVADYGTRLILSGQYSLQAAQAGLQIAQVTQQTLNGTQSKIDKFTNCIVNVIAKTALQQLTISVVNWINGGFKGQPSFVNNFQQFFTNTADLAAGQFIQGSGLAFLCSPFQLQIKIAIAQSYANRSAQSCSLTKVVSNINNFMNGNFAAGGWGGLVSFTTIPTNNPYGAFAYAQAGLANAQTNALANAKNNISPTGFLNLQKQVCTGNTTISANAGISLNSQAGQTICQPGCTCSVVTPGAVIADSLGAVNKSGVDQLGLTQDIDQIITALTTQLMQKILQNGLTSLSQPTTQTAADLAAQSQALTMLNDMQSKITLEQQLGAIQQGSIADIQAVQAQLNGLANCWGAVASSTNDNTAAQHAADANTTLQSLNAQVAAFNNNITQINNKIAVLNQFESDLSLAASVADVNNVASRYNAAVAAGTFASQADLTTAQQNRATLQSSLATTNQATQTSLAQCNAAGGQ